MIHCVHTDSDIILVMSGSSRALREGDGFKISKRDWVSVLELLVDRALRVLSILAKERLSRPRGKTTERSASQRSNVFCRSLVLLSLNLPYLVYIY